MLRRFDAPSSSRLHQPEWEDPDEGSKFLFEARKQFRKIVVMIDADLMSAAPTPTTFTPQHLLVSLLSHKLVRLYRYADDGPPPDTPSVQGHPNLHEGWAVVQDADPERMLWSVVHEPSPGNYALSGVMGNGGDVAAKDRGSSTYESLGTDEAASRRRADWLASQVAAQALGADLYITERPYLHAASWSIARGTALCGVEDALALLGLYFRAQDEYPILDRLSSNRGLYFWVGTRELLPEAWRWFTACVQHATGASDDSLLVLGGSLLQRVQRALEARDQVHLALNQPQDNDTQQRALAHLDTVLLFLMAAVDVAARVSHVVLGVSGDEYQAGWQKQGKGGWVSKIRVSAPSLAAVVDPGTQGEQALTILRLLRNSVHGAALQGLAVVNGGAPLENLVGLPPHDEAKLLACMDALGGRSAWGVKGAKPRSVFLDPGVFVDRLFEEVLALLNDLMKETPVEQLAHVALAPADCQPPPASGPSLFGDPFDEGPRSSIRWQLGF